MEAMTNENQLIQVEKKPGFFEKMLAKMLWYPKVFLAMILLDRWVFNPFLVGLKHKGPLVAFSFGAKRQRRKKKKGLWTMFEKFTKWSIAGFTVGSIVVLFGFFLVFTAIYSRLFPSQAQELVEGKKP